jgi:hypothetical protein
MILDLDGQKDLSQYVRAADIPSSKNKAYQSPVAVFGFVGEKLGRAFDPVEVSHAETATQDVVKTPRSFLALIGIVAVGFIVYSMVRKA